MVKDSTLSDWEAEILDEKQISYASIDAYSSYVIGKPKHQVGKSATVNTSKWQKLGHEDEVNQNSREETSRDGKKDDAMKTDAKPKVSAKKQNEGQLVDLGEAGGRGSTGGVSAEKHKKGWKAVDFGEAAALFTTHPETLPVKPLTFYLGKLFACLEKEVKEDESGGIAEVPAQTDGGKMISLLE
ncbi:Werner syndrome-like exonuclease [Tanacetum coccineum]